MQFEPKFVGIDVAEAEPLCPLEVDSGKLEKMTADVAFSVIWQ